MLTCLRVLHACCSKTYYVHTCLRTWCTYLSYLLYISIVELKRIVHRNTVLFRQKILKTFTFLRFDVLWLDTICRFKAVKINRVAFLGPLSFRRIGFLSVLSSSTCIATLKIVQSRFHTYCLLWAPKKLFNQALRFLPCTGISLLISLMKHMPFHNFHNTIFSCVFKCRITLYY